MVKSYLVTIKNNANTFSSIAELERALALARGLYPNGDWHSEAGYELDSICRMHLHTMVKFPNVISCKNYARKFQPKSSWHINFTPVKKGTEATAYNYCLKEKSPSVRENDSFEHFFQKQLKLINLFKMT